MRTTKPPPVGKGKEPNADIDEKPQKKKRGLNSWFEGVANSITRAVGRPMASLIAMLIVVVWAIAGPFYGFSETWQLLINTSTTIITFLMVFIIQMSANKDTIAVQLKLNELIAANKNASNRLIDIEDLTADELELLKKFYVQLSELAEKEKDLFSSHSIDDANKVHDNKKKSATHRARGAH